MTLRCPTCKTVTTWEENPVRPFCSERCKLIDLGAWADNKYRIPVEQDDQSQPAEDSATKEPPKS